MAGDWKKRGGGGERERDTAIINYSRRRGRDQMVRMSVVGRKGRTNNEGGREGDRSIPT
jgi:hypothetical protein